MKRLGSLAVVLLILAGCSPPKEFKMSRDEALNPETCRECHPDHVAEWEGSMHAYAADDPVFRAMNQRGQEETGGELGELCVQCHAPMAFREGLTTDGLNLDDVPQEYKGVTCYFCHTIKGIEDDHNAKVTLAGGIAMRGGISNPVQNDAHPSKYSLLHDRNDLESATLCGSCHDIVNDNDVHLERTFAEWKETLFAQDTPARQTCGHCHTRGRDGLAADYPGVFLRRVHDHSMVGVDVALTDWPAIDEQKAKIKDELDDTLSARLCVNPNGGGSDIVVRLENVAAGHNWPSGAAQDRRAWLEIVAYDDTDAELFSTGVVDADEPVSTAAESDPNLWVFRDRIYDDSGDEVHMFWEAADFDSELLPGTVTTDPEDPLFYHYKERTWSLPGIVPDHVTIRVHIRPVGLDVLDSLVDSGHLDAQYRATEQVTLGFTDLVWTGPLGTCVP